MGRPMKTAREKKMAAAMAAVAAFLQREEEAYYGALTLALTPPAPKPEPPAAPTNLWGQSGRLEIMQLRNAMQMKAVHRF